MISLGQRILTNRDPIGHVTPLLMARISVESHSPTERSCTLWLSTLFAPAHSRLLISGKPRPVSSALSPALEHWLTLLLPSEMPFSPTLSQLLLALRNSAAPPPHLRSFPDFSRKEEDIFYSLVCLLLCLGTVLMRSGAGGMCYPFLCVWCIMGTL